MNFFITGLPRSRTAWLANLFTTGPIFCWHDALKNPRKVRGLVEQCREARRTFGKVSYLGDADSGAAFFMPEILETFPAAKWVFVHRAFEDCYVSFRRGFPTLLSAELSLKGFELAENKLHEAVASIPAENQLGVDFDDLDNIETVRGIWNFCVPSEPFPVHRWEFLNPLRVTVIADKAYKGLV